MKKKEATVRVSKKTVDGREWGSKIRPTLEFTRVMGAEPGNSVVTDATIISAGNAQLIVEIKGDPLSAVPDPGETPARCTKEQWREISRNSAITDIGVKMMKDLFEGDEPPTVYIDFSDKVIDGLREVKRVRFVKSGRPTSHPLWAQPDLN